MMTFLKLCYVRRNVGVKTGDPAVRYAVKTIVQATKR